MQSNTVSSELEEQIVAAFPSSLSLSPSDCVAIRTSLYSLRDEDVLAVLGTVLVDLLDTHRDSPGVVDWADSVVRFLCSADPPLLESSSQFPDFVRESNAFAASQKPEAERLFSKFTIEQARAVYRWLQAASQWKESGIAEDELSAALGYWGRKAATTH